MKLSIRLLVLGGAVLFVLATHGIGWAQPRDAATAEALFRQGREALARGDYATACPRFAESQRLDPAVGTLMNLAECEEHEGRLAQAWESWHEAMDQLLRTGDERIEIARKHADDLDKRVPRLLVRLAPGLVDASVARDGVVLGAPSLGVSLPVDPGKHRLVVTAKDRAPAETSVSLVEGDSKEVVVDAGPRQARLDAPPAEPAPEPARPAGPWRTVGFVALGVGGAALVTAVVSGVLVAHDKSVVDSSCNGARGCSQDGVDAASAGKTWLAVNTIASIATVAFTGVGVVLIVTHPAQRTTARLAPTALGAGGGVSLSGAF